MFTQDNRPVYLNLLKIRLPIAGIISIMHRIFGLLLALSIPFFSVLFGLSLHSEESFNQALSILNAAWLQVILAGFIWAFVHHFFSGIRYLFLDIEWGVSKRQSVTTSWLVLSAALIVSLIIFAGIWL